MKKTAKVKKETLDLINDIRSSQSKSQSEIGSLEIQKHLLLHDLHVMADRLRSIMSDLEKKHGKGTLNLETGKVELDGDS